ncbi:MAG: cation diffusion facilitator family transporter [Planctomycetales bacterium]
MTEPIDFEKGIRSSQLGILVNAALAAIKLIAGVVGNAYVLIADAVESAADIVSSLIVLAGLQIARRDPDEAYPFGYGRAETLAAAVVALLLLGTAVGITVEAVREIQIPHHAPAPWTLGILVTVMIVKWARRPPRWPGRRGTREQSGPGRRLASPQRRRHLRRRLHRHQHLPCDGPWLGNGR